MGAKLNRVKDYQERLVNYADSVLPLPFEWGKTDCISLSLNCVSVMYDRPDLVDFIDWTSEAEGRAFFETVSTPDVWLSSFEAVNIPRESIRSGDVVVGFLPERQIPFSYFCVGSKLLSSLPEAGVFVSPFRILGRLPTNAAAFRLP